MNYEKVMQEIELLGKSGMNLGLGRIKKLLSNMGNPEKKLRFIHIAGTNGKGSTSTMLCNILAHAGYQTGLFTSPFIVSMREMFQINGKMIGKEAFAKCATEVFRIAEQTIVEGEHPTQFEVLTAIAFACFLHLRCDYVCLEVGLGGREDSTNVIPQAVLQIITSISKDHTAFLGNSIEEITREKAGIIKGGTTVVYPLLPKEALNVIQERIVCEHGTLVQPNLSELTILDQKWQTSSFSYKGLIYNKQLNGEHQVYNCVTAIEAATALRQQGLLISQEDIFQGIAQTTVPARLEILQENPFILMDGAHNEGGAIALEKILKKLDKQPMYILMGVLADKEYHKLLSHIAPYANTFIAVSPKNPRAMEAATLCEYAKEFCENSIVYETVDDAIAFALQAVEQQGMCVICGSLYLASEIREKILNWR